MAKIKIGDIVEIVTKNGFSYAQYTHKNPSFGALLRVFGENFSDRPQKFDDIVNVRPVFMTFFPLGTAIHRGIFSVVANVDVPAHALPFPTFRAGIPNPATGKVDVWWLWDGETEWPVGKLTEEQRSLSLRGIWNDTFLVERIESGWTPETDPWT